MEDYSYDHSVESEQSNITMLDYLIEEAELDRVDHEAFMEEIRVS
ncbi:hypothetical protein B0O40_1956 [Ruminococcaceae bacterium R-25]|nr:hypothetical protein B0O40_1956 [Ruminococcaceae bacterium R-25]SUQ21819.1 hypothetical protein SAMN06297423_1956 [Oscillospiraceae bacterium]